MTSIVENPAMDIQHLMRAGTLNITSLPPLSLYIHLPWCLKKCPYCDFNSHEKPSQWSEQEYIDALLYDLDQQKNSVRGRRLETLFIGGGTPSLFSPESFDRLLRGIDASISIAPNAEITLEANPGASDAERFRRYRDIGINRLSIGIQSFNDELLKKIGRVHDGREASMAASMAREAGFCEFNLDLIFGLPGQTEALALSDIETAIQLEPTHISFYQLTLEPNTLFYKFPPKLPNEDLTWSIQEVGQARLKEAGYGQYEVSAYARAGSRARHNLNYWTFGDYLGIGAGAHGKITDSVTGAICRTERLKMPQSYMKAAQSGASLGTERRIQDDEIAFEFLMNGLRLREGFKMEDFMARTRLKPETLEPTLSRLLNQELLERAPDGIRCTSHGYNFLDTILQSFLNTPC